MALPGFLTLQRLRCLAILALLCATAGVRAQDTLRVLAWHDRPGRVVFEARVGERVVVSNAYFEYR